MIVVLTGTNGSGKTHAVRELISGLDSRPVQVFKGRRRPDGMIYDQRKLFTPGHYSIGNGGMDTMPYSVQVAYDVVKKFAKNYDVVTEGKNQSRAVDCVIDLTFRFELVVVHLTTPLAQCIQSVRARGHSLSDASIARTYAKCERDVIELEKTGVEIHRLSREEVVPFIKEKLKWTS